MRKILCGYISINPMHLLQEKDQGMIKVSLGMRCNTQKLRYSTEFNNNNNKYNGILLRVTVIHSLLDKHLYANTILSCLIWIWIIISKFIVFLVHVNFVVV